jgi:predicted amidophosphoribosyltransferase
LLAVALAEQADLAVDESHLIRARATPPQVGLGAEARQENVKGAFAWVGDRLTGVRVLLIDDVCTTGSTLGACASPLRQAGAKAVWALTLARARDRRAR